MDYTAHLVICQTAIMAAFQQAGDQGILRIEPKVSLRISITIAVPLLQARQEAQQPDELYVDSMLRLPLCM